MPQTGPKTPDGKRRIRHNALKHGILSTDTVIERVESREDYDQFRESILQSIQPQGGLEGAFVDRIVNLFWRLARVVRFERESTINAQDQVGANIAAIYKLQGKELPDPPDEDFRDLADQLLMANLMPDAATLNIVMRHETRLHRHLLQSIHMLALIKGFRRNLPHNSKDGVASLDVPDYNRNKPALPRGPAIPTQN